MVNELKELTKNLDYDLQKILEQTSRTTTPVQYCDLWAKLLIVQELRQLRSQLQTKAISELERKK